MLTLTSEYALRALIFMAQHVGDQPHPGAKIAGETGIPPKYLAKILGDLVRAGVLASSRGRGGGFRLGRSPKKIRLFEALSVFEAFGRRRCPFGNPVCNDEDPCVAHRRWKKVVESQMKFFKGTTLQDVASKESRSAGPKKRSKHRKRRMRR